MWVSLGDSVSTSHTFSFDGVGPVWVARSATEFTNAVKIRALPAHLVLDRKGRVVEGDVGATLLPVRSYRNDCTIMEPASE